MKIKDRLEYKGKASPLTVTPDTKVHDAVKKMTELNYGCVIVVDGKKIVGIMTERDLFKRLLANDLDQHKTPVSEIMTADVKVASEEDNLIDWLRIMSNERFRHLPIVDDNGNVINIMSQGDFVSYTWPELLEQMKTATKAVIAPNYQILFIVAALLIYAVVVPVIYNLFF